MYEHTPHVKRSASEPTCSTHMYIRAYTSCKEVSLRTYMQWYTHVHTSIHPIYRGQPQNLHAVHTHMYERTPHVERSTSGPTCSTHMYECTPHVQRPQYIHTFTQQRIEVMVGIDIELDIADIVLSGALMNCPCFVLNTCPMSNHATFRQTVSL